MAPGMLPSPSAVRVAWLVEPQPARLRGRQRSRRWRPGRDRVEQVVYMAYADLVALAARVGVRPGERPTSLPRPAIPVRYAV